MFDPLAPAPASLATIIDTHDLAHGGRADEPASAYGMFVPKRWACATAFSGVTSGLGVPEPLGAFLLEPSPQSPAVLVTMCRFGAEIGVEDFLRYRSSSDGWSVRDVRWTPGLHGPRLQLSAMQTTEDPELRVTTAIVDNARLFLVEAVARERWWPELHARMWPCGLSFGLAAPTCVERLGRTRTVETEQLAFEAPAEWRTVASKPQRVSLELRHRDRSLAWMGVERRATPEVDRPAHVRRIDSRLARGGAVVTSSVLAEDPRVRGKAIPGWAFTAEHTATRGEQRITARSAMRETDKGIIELVVIGPTLADDPAGWARTKRAFELAAQSC